MDEKLANSHSLDGENLALDKMSNEDRGEDNKHLGVKSGKVGRKSSKLERELKRISYK
jgi:hypothetical protein